MPPRSRKRAVTNEELAIRELAAQVERRERELHLARRRREHEAQRAREHALPFLNEMDAATLDAFVAAMMALLSTWPRYVQIQALLHDPERIVRDVVNALAQNTRGATGRAETTFNLQARRCRGTCGGALARQVQAAESAYYFCARTQDGCASL
jgi:hypothetical protein